MKDIFWLILVLALTGACKEQEMESAFQTQNQDVLKDLIEENYLLNPKDVTALLAAPDDSYVLVDVRDRYEYEQAHITDAINIPVQELLEKTSLELFADTGLSYILYGSGQLQSNGPWMILKSMGYNNILVSPGGFPIDETWKGTDPSGYDYASSFQEVLERNKKEEKAAKSRIVVAPKPKVVLPKPKPKPKAEEEEEGC